MSSQTPERKYRMTFPYPNSYETEDRGIKFTHDSRFNHGRLIFVATTTGVSELSEEFRRTERWCLYANILVIVVPHAWSAS